jgi:hypothetical protein
MITKPGIIYSFMVVIITLSLCAFPHIGVCEDPQWRSEFDEACANTASAMALTTQELQALITRCEKLQKIIEQLDESTRKVFLKRVLMCKNLYQYVLDSKKGTAENGAQ